MFGIFQIFGLGWGLGPGDWGLGPGAWGLGCGPGAWCPGPGGWARAQQEPKRIASPAVSGRR